MKKQLTLAAILVVAFGILFSVDFDAMRAADNEEAVARGRLSPAEIGEVELLEDAAKEDLQGDLQEGLQQH